MAQPSAPAGVALTTDLSEDSAIPYFLWDEPLTVGQLREQLSESEENRERLLGKIMREARETDVWLQVRFGTIIVDSAEEILANKLCTLLSSEEVRDLVDVARSPKPASTPSPRFRRLSGRTAG